MNPYEVFPDLTWTEILKNVEDLTDKLKLINLHSALRVQFEDEKIDYSFQLVLPIVLEHFQKDPRGLEYGGPLNEERKKILLNCRLVNKGARTAVDQWLRSYWDFHNPDAAPRVFARDDFKEYLNLSERGIAKFLSDFNGDDEVAANIPPNYMPIITRCVHAMFPLHFFIEDEQAENYNAQGEANVEEIIVEVAQEEAPEEEAQEEGAREEQAREDVAQVEGAREEEAQEEEAREDVAQVEEAREEGAQVEEAREEEEEEVAQEVVVRQEGIADLERFHYERVELIFRMIGPEVRNAVFDIHWVDIAEAENALGIWDRRWAALCNVIQSCPSLRALNVFIQTPPFMSQFEDQVRDELFHLPPLPSLTHLSWLHGGSTDDADLNLCQQYFPQLLDLSVMDLGGWKREYSLNAATFFPKLQNLSLKHYHFYEHLINKPTLLHLLGNFNAPHIEIIGITICFEPTEITRDAIEKEGKDLAEKGTDMLNKLLVNPRQRWECDLTRGINFVTFYKVNARV